MDGVKNEVKDELQYLQTEHGITFTNNIITGQTTEEVYQEWLRNRENNIIDLKQNKILESKLKLSEYLETHPILSYCHNGEPDYYNVTMEKQAQLNALVTLMDKAQQMEIPFIPMWNATGKECEEWKYQEIYQLSFEIYNYVKPLVTEQQRLEVLIQSLNTREEIENLVIDYDNVG